MFPKPAKPSPVTDAGKLAKTIEHLHRNYHEALPTMALARIAGLSVSPFERTFRKAFDATHGYVPPN